MAKLMLVEDDNNLREIYQARLQAEGYTIVSAKDGEEALVTAKAEKPDLIIADIMMPKISGFEMLDILRNTDGLKDVKVIMLTALGQNDDQQRANQLGADRYLVKSQVTLEDIVKAAHELLGDQSAPAAAAPEPQPAENQSAAAEPATPVAPAPEPEAPPAPEPPASDPPKPAPPTPTAIPITAAGPSEQTPTPESAAETGNLAQSTAQEEAVADNRIEDFVAGASEEATPPPATPAVTPESNADTAPESVAPTESVEIPPAAATINADDDKLVTDAAQTLVDSTNGAEAAKPDTAPTVATVNPDSDSAGGAKPDDDNSTETTHSEKVITPLNSQPKQDLDTLLAVEEAKEAGAKPAPSTPIVVTDDSAGQAAAQPQNPVIQPSSDVAAPTGTSTPAPDPTASNGSPDPNQIAL